MSAGVQFVIGKKKQLKSACGHSSPPSAYLKCPYGTKTLP